MSESDGSVVFLSVIFLFTHPYVLRNIMVNINDQSVCGSKLSYSNFIFVKLLSSKVRAFHLKMTDGSYVSIPTDFQTYYCLCIFAVQISIGGVHNYADYVKIV